MFNKRGWPAESIRSIQLQGAVRGVGSCLTAAAASRALAGAGSSLARVLRGFRRGLRGLGLLCPSCGSSVFQRPAGPSWAVPRACALALVRRRAHRCAARMGDQRQHDGCDAEPPALWRPLGLFRSGPASFSRASAVLVSTGTRNSSWATCNYSKKCASESGRRKRCRIVYAYYAATQSVAVPRQRFFQFVLFF